MAPSFFGAAELQRAVAAAIPTDLPDGHRNAIVAAVDASGVTLVVGFSRPSPFITWQVQGDITHTWAGDTKVGAHFVGSW